MAPAGITMHRPELPRRVTRGVGDPRRVIFQKRGVQGPERFPFTRCPIVHFTGRAFMSNIEIGRVTS